MDKAFIIAILIGFAMLHGLANYIRESTLPDADLGEASLAYRGG
jgi:hypothetical protein